MYRLTALPVGTYDVTAELQGFTKVENKAIVLNVGQSLDVDMMLKLATVQESITVTAETPLIETVLVGRRRRRHRPHREPAAQRPAVREPRGDDSRRRPRFPLRPDQELAVLAADQRRQRPQRELPDRRRRQQRRHRRRAAATLPARGDPGIQLRDQRFKAEYGRSNGGVMNIVTKSGTNDYHGSFFTLFRDKSLNSRTIRPADRATSTRPTIAAISSAARSAARSCTNKAHFFGAIERTQQDTNQAVNTLGLFPSTDGVFSDAVSREPRTVRAPPT